MEVEQRQLRAQRERSKTPFEPIFFRCACSCAIVSCVQRSCIAAPKHQTAELQQHPSFTLRVCRTTNSHSRVLLSISKSLLCTRLTLPPATAPITASRCTCREEKGWWVSNKNAISTFHQKAMQV